LLAGPLLRNIFSISADHPVESLNLTTQDINLFTMTIDSLDLVSAALLDLRKCFHHGLVVILN